MDNQKLFLDLNIVVDISNYINSLKVWQEWKKLLQQQGHAKQDYFRMYFRAIKPVVYYFSQIQKLDPKKYAFYTCDLDLAQILELKQMFGKFIQNLEILKQFQIIDKNSEKIEQAKKKVSEELLKDLFKVQDNPIFKIDLNSQPKNNQIKYWGNTVKIPHIKINGKIIKGKGIAAKDLGMPTANIELSQTFNKLLLDYPNAIYATSVKMESGQIYLGAACLGTNPHYENTKANRFLQIYILHNFNDTQFYSQNLEAKFSSFDAFLNGMRNDIEITKNFKHLLPESMPSL